MCVFFWSTKLNYLIFKKVRRGVAMTAMEKTVAMAAGRNKKNTTTAQT